MKRNLLLSLIALLIGVVTVSAQRKGSAEERRHWMREIQHYKVEYVTKTLKLTDEQKAKFVPMYQSMEADQRKLQEETRRLERSVVKRGDKVSDLEYEKASEALYELKSKEGKIELDYMKKFKTVLSPQQLFNLKIAERKFTRELMKHHAKKRDK